MVSASEQAPTLRGSRARSGAAAVSGGNRRGVRPPDLYEVHLHLLLFVGWGKPDRNRTPSLLRLVRLDSARRSR
eukprot:1643832-Rhodomonas_salina.1